MSQATDFLENKIMAHVFSNTAYTAPATIYAALFTTAPNDAGSGTEVTGGSYARQSMAFTTTGDTSSNTASVEFPKATASWGTVTHFAVYDAVTAGNMLMYGTLTTSKAIDINDTFRFDAGEVDLTAA